MIKTEYIIGIFDIETTSVCSITKSFLTNAEKRRQVICTSAELPKSYILYKEKNKTTVYLTQFSTTTLQKRNLNKEI